MKERDMRGVLTFEVLGVKGHDCFLDECHRSIDDAAWAMLMIDFSHGVLVQCCHETFDHTRSAAGRDC